MGDVGDMWKAYKETKKALKEQKYESNIYWLGCAKISQSLTFIDKGTACLFRTKGKPKVDFYPHTGRWRIVGSDADGKLYEGGAQEFLQWYSLL